MANHAKKCDAVVAGAGPAGLAAALTAARGGMETLLLEREPHPGGTIRTAMHSAICGLYGDDSAEVTDTLNGGVTREVCSRLSRISPEISRVQRRGKTRILPFRPGDFYRCWRDLLEGESNLTMRCAIAVEDAEPAAGRVQKLALSDGTQIRPGVVIDGTGNAAVARMVGADLMHDPPKERQLGAFSLRFSGIEGDRAGLQLEVPYEMRKAAENGDLPRVARYATFSPSPSAGHGICRLAVPVFLFQDRRSLATYVQNSRRVLRESVPALARAPVVETSPWAIPRDGPRLCGRRVLDRSDVLEARKFGGGVRAAWPIEFWHPEEGPQYEYVPAGQSYEVPPACLRPRGFSNLICTGRAISATARAAASLRVAGICLALGQLAGEVAADLCP